MSEAITNVAVVLLFILIGGCFAAAELALVSLRESQVQRLATTAGKRGRRLADLHRDPNRFLAAGQVGVTLASFVSAGFGASQIAPSLVPWFTGLGLSTGVSETLAFIVITVVIAYFSLVLGELVPKRLALQRAESISLLAAGPVDLLATVSRPFIWLLSRSTDLIVRLLGGDPGASREVITGEELRGIVAAHEALSDEERELIDEVFEAGDRELREVMVPRTEVDFVDVAWGIAKAARIVAELPRSRYPVFRGSPDDIVGFVHLRDVLVADRNGSPDRVGDLVRDVKAFPGSKHVIPALQEMRAEGHHLAVVADEYGGTAGIVTLEDLVEELVGDIRDEYDDEEGTASIRDGEALEVDGLTNLEDFEDDTGIELPEGPYETVAGFLVAEVGELPIVGTRAATAGYLFTVVALDGRRIARIRVEPEPSGDDDRRDRADDPEGLAGAAPEEPGGSGGSAGPGQDSARASEGGAEPGRARPAGLGQ